MSVFKLPKMKKEEIEKLVREQIICRVAYQEDNGPTMSLFQYTELDGSLFFHFTEYGEKLKMLEKGGPVAVEIDDFAEDLGEFRFALLKGRLKVVTDSEKKAKVIDKMALEGRNRLSTKFLAAHGLGEGSDWSSFKAKKDLTVVEFIPTKAVGLRSP